MNDNDNEVGKALWAVAVSLGSLVAGITLIGAGTNIYIALGVFFLIMYYNSTQEE
jgi:hypothetical protein